MKKNIIKLIITFLIFFLLDTFILKLIFIFNNNFKITVYFYLVMAIIKLIILLFLYQVKLKIDDHKTFFKNIKSSFKYYYIALALSILLNIAINNLGITLRNQHSITNIFKNNFLAAFLLINILSPIIEELIFRKAFKEVIKDELKYIVLSSIIFGAMHLLNSSSPYEYLYLIPYSILGSANAISYIKTKNIIYPIIVHVFNNSLSTLFIVILGGHLWIAV